MSILHADEILGNLTDERELFQEFQMYVPARFVWLVSRGVEPEVAADLVADDGLPVCYDPPDVADDGGIVMEWAGMYEEAA